MNKPLLSHGLGFLSLLFVLAPVAANAHNVAEEMADAANNFLALLTPEQRAKATFDFKDGERLNWHFVPRDRKGLPWKDMTPEQQHLGHALFSTALSHRGYFKATTIMTLEQVLRETEAGGRGTIVRDPSNYYFSLFGQPTAKGTWGWRVEGHHLAFNFTIVDGQEIAAAPTFFGSNPAEVKTGPRKGLRVLSAEEDLGRKVVQSLTEEQKKVAIFATNAPSDIITGTNRVTGMLKPEGLAMSKMTKEQSDALWDVVQEYVRRTRPEIADKDLERIKKAGTEKIFFAWAGPIEPGKGHYYRVQGPTFLLEYDDTQNNANHIHAVWRNLENDFGEDLLKKHYAENPH